MLLISSIRVWWKRLNLNRWYIRIYIYWSCLFFLEAIKNVLFGHWADRLWFSLQFVFYVQCSLFTVHFHVQALWIGCRCVTCNAPIWFTFIQFDAELFLLIHIDVRCVLFLHAPTSNMGFQLVGWECVNVPFIGCWLLIAQFIMSRFKEPNKVRLTNIRNWGRKWKAIAIKR